MDIHGSINLKGNKLEEGKFDLLTELPTNPEPGTWAFYEKRLMLSVEHEGHNIWLPLTPVKDTFVKNFTATPSWLIPHNLASESVLVQCFGEDKKAVVPTNIEVIDENTVEVKFPDNVAGTAIVMFGYQEGSALPAMESAARDEEVEALTSKVSELESSAAQASTVEEMSTKVSELESALSTLQSSTSKNKAEYYGTTSNTAIKALLSKASMAADTGLTFPSLYLNALRVEDSVSISGSLQVDGFRHLVDTDSATSIDFNPTKLGEALNGLFSGIIGKATGIANIQYYDDANSSDSVALPGTVGISGNGFQIRVIEGFAPDGQYGDRAFVHFSANCRVS